MATFFQCIPLLLPCVLLMSLCLTASANDHHDANVNEESHSETDTEDAFHNASGSFQLPDKRDPRDLCWSRTEQAFFYKVWRLCLVRKLSQHLSDNTGTTTELHLWIAGRACVDTAQEKLQPEVLLGEEAEQCSPRNGFGDTANLNAYPRSASLLHAS